MRETRLGAIEFRTGSPLEFAGILRRGSSGALKPAICVGYLNPHVYNRAAADPQVARFLRKCEFVCLDGIGAVYAGSVQNLRPLKRMVMYQVFDSAVAGGLLSGSALLLGLTGTEIESARARLAEASPSLRIVGCHDGFLPEKEYDRILRAHADVDYVLAGMGSPKSERVLLRASEICGHAVCWHVGGGTLRSWAGTKKHSPRMVSRMGLEWLHRAVFEPETRIRYARGIPEFVFRLSRDAWNA